MTSDFRDKSILIAGFGGLLGSVLVKALLNEGAKVYAFDLDVNKSSERLRELGVDVESERLFLKSVDITNENILENYMLQLDSIDGAINAAYPRNRGYGKTVEDVSLESFNENVSLHLGSAFVFMKICLKIFKSNKQPFSLVNVGSIYGVVAPDFEIYKNTSMTMPIEYAAIKSSIIHLTRYLSSYASDSRFKVNCISPGGIFDNHQEPFLSQYKNKTLGKGLLNVTDVIGPILFLLSDRSKFITGQNIIVDDGFTISS